MQDLECDGRPWHARELSGGVTSELCGRDPDQGQSMQQSAFFIQALSHNPVNFLLEFWELAEGICNHRMPVITHHTHGVDVYLELD